MLDFTLLGTANDELRYSQSLRGYPIDPVKMGILNNRSKFSSQRVGEPAPASDSVVDPQNNSNARLTLTPAFGAPAVTFKADWNTTCNFCLTYFQWGPGMWAQQEVIV